MPMSSLNVAEWTPEQVADWLSGLGPTVAKYVPALKARGLDGAKLLTLRCDDLEYLGMHVIGHQELLLEAVEHLRNFQYEVSRECVQQLALRVSVVATTLARTLRHHPDARLETQTLADVARTVHAVKPLVCWLDRWPLCSSGAAAASLAERKAALLKLSLEAATCAQRDRFAEQPARAVAAAAANTAATADYIIQDVSDPMILQPASLDTVTLRQGGKPLGFNVVPSFCGHHQLADIRFGSPAHASGAVHIGDEIVQVGNQCVIGWSGDSVIRLLNTSGSELQLRLRRRAARPPPALHTPQLAAPGRRLHRLLHYRPHHLYADLTLHSRCETLSPLPASPPAEEETAQESSTRDDPPSSSDESEPLSPPASPTHTHLDHTRMYPPKPRAAVQRRHTICGDTPLYKRPSHHIEQFWQELKQQKWGHEGGSTSMTPTPDDTALYARDKAVSCSTGLELSPRPRTCLGVVLDRPTIRPKPIIGPTDEMSSDRNRGKLDKSHSTPAYDFDASIDEPGPLAAQTIPESPTTPTDTPSIDKADRILDFKKSSSQIGEAILQRGRRQTELSESDKGSIGGDNKNLGLTTGGDKTLGSFTGGDKTLGSFTGGDKTLGSFTGGDKNTGSSTVGDKLGSPTGNDRSFGETNIATQRVLDTINIAMLEHRRRSAAQNTANEAQDMQPRWSRSTPGGPPSPPPRPAASYPVLRAVPRALEPPHTPLKPARQVDPTHISVPLRHITKHDIQVISSDRRELPAINSPETQSPPRRPDIVVGAQAQSEANSRLALSPTSAVRGIFPTSKSRSLKKKSSILAKRRLVSARWLAARGAGGWVWQRVRARGAAQPRWAPRHLLLAHNLLYAYRTPECAKADCMIYLEGCTVAAAGEVKSRAHAFKVYHTGNAFYFACDSKDAQQAWIQLIHKATLLPSLASNMDVSKQFSETDYSETESETEGGSGHTEGSHKERDKDREKDKDKDKSKFGSLKKLTHRMQRSESHEHVAHTSLDRKYLRFFTRNKPKDDSKVKSKQGVPVPTEHYRSYRRAPLSPPPSLSPPTLPPPPAAPPAPPRRVPAPINYIHASNPNLLDFDKSDFVTKPTLHVPKPNPKSENLVGFVTLEQFMLKKQEEERRQVYTNRVLMGVEHQQHHHLMQRLDNIVPDVIYGELGSTEGGTSSTGSSTGGTGGGKPVSVRGKDGYEKIVYRDDPPSTSRTRRRSPPAPPAPAPWRDSLRRNDKVHTTSAEGTALKGSAQYSPLSHNAHLHLTDSNRSTGPDSENRLRNARRVGHYPHLVCPPTFQPETYCLSRLPPRHPHNDT